jgi:hypothetical protein
LSGANTLAYFNTASMTKKNVGTRNVMKRWKRKKKPGANVVKLFYGCKL